MRILFGKKKKKMKKNIEKKLLYKNGENKSKDFCKVGNAPHLVCTNPPFDDSRRKFIRMMLFVRFAL